MMNSSFSKTVLILKNSLRQSFTRSFVTSKIYFNAPPTKLPHESTKRDINETDNRPIKFMGSKAATWSARESRTGTAEEMLWYQPYVVVGSVAVFLIYFCILREESDIDRKLEGSLFDHISGLEEAQLVISYRYNRDNGLDVKDIENRLSELGIDAKSLN